MEPGIPDSTAVPGGPSPLHLWALGVGTAVLVALGLAAAAATGHCPLATVCGPGIDVDLVQPRLDTALPPPQQGFVYDQSFVAGHNGLSEIDLLLAAHDPAIARETGNGRLEIALLDSQGRVVSERVLEGEALAHNTTVTLRFAPQPQSGGQSYSLRLSGNDANRYGVWGYSLDVLQPGALTAEGPATATAVQELRFETRYTLGWRAAATLLAQQLTGNIWLILAALSLLPLPGCLLLLAGRTWGWEPAVWWGVAVALGVALWPVIWLWLTLLGGHWTAATLWGAVVAGWLVVLLLWLRKRGGRIAQSAPQLSRHTLVANGLLLMLLLVSVGVRLLAVRDLAFPPWVDSSRHGLITAVMAEQGTYPQSYHPYLPVASTPYHYGFHTLSAGLLFMTGAPLPQLLLILGQLLNGLLPLTIYAAGWLFTRNRGIALLAAFLVALPFYFPGYYATWGRFTQLAAVFVLPVLLALSWRLGRGGSRAWPLVGVLAAGLFLLHFRVFLFYLPFAMLVAVEQLFSNRRLRPLVKAGGLALTLSLPRLIQLWQELDPGQELQTAVEGYNALPVGYLTAGWERYYYGLAAVGLLVVLAAVWRRWQWAKVGLLLAAWVGLMFLLLSGDRLGLPETLVININSLVISLFVPLSMFLAIVVGIIWYGGARLLRRPAFASVERPIALVAAVVAGGLLALLALFGIRQQTDILNSQTILAGEIDRRALAWLDENLPQDALVAVNSWQWSGSTWAASDGGAWLVPLTGRQATTPPIDHIYDTALFSDVIAFNESAAAVADWSLPEAAVWLYEQGVTHVFVGERGGFLDPAELDRNPALRMIHQDGGTFLFELAAD